MKTENRKLVIIGAGAAGMAAASSAANNGISDILLIEQGPEAGGILNQCIHNGFGLHTYKEELSGPAYAGRLEQEVVRPEIELWLDSTVTDLSKDKVVTVQSAKHGYRKIQAEAVILAMGSRERTRGAIQIPGTRPAGIYNAGQAQKFLNLDGSLVGHKVFILGSGDIGLIMARRMTLEGAEVLGVAELMPYSNGLARNVKQCLEDFDIPLYLSHTVTDIKGKDQLEHVVISRVDETGTPIPGTEKAFDVDTLLLSVGLIPDNRLSENAGISLSPSTKGAVVDESCMTDVDGIFACGNVLHVHDLVDYVHQEGTKAGKAAADWLKGSRKQEKGKTIPQKAGAGTGYVLPQSVHLDAGNVEVFFRVRKPVKNAVVKITCGSFEKRIKKRVMLPAEMEKAVLTASELEQMDGNEILWEVLHD